MNWRCVLRSNQGILLDVASPLTTPHWMDLQMVCSSYTLLNVSTDSKHLLYHMCTYEPVLSIYAALGKFFPREEP